MPNSVTKERSCQIGAYTVGSQNPRTCIAVRTTADCSSDASPSSSSGCDRTIFPNVPSLSLSNLKAIDHDDSRCDVVAHRRKHLRHTLQSNTLVYDQTGFLGSRLAHGEHLCKLLALHSERSAQPKFIEEDYVDWKRHI